jgi:RHH-type proline utilization regulon transcriptional repressor/proline dehydrogenase/delta 1-pyrroline-5-carboxylate dehydrogenase
MCLAEALLRMPDNRDHRQADQATRSAASRLAGASRQERLALRQRLDLGPDADGPRARRSTSASAATWGGLLKRLVQRSGEPVIRAAMSQAMKHPGPPVRHGPQYRRGHVERARKPRRQGLSLLLRHAGRGRPHDGGRRPLSAVLSRLPSRRSAGGPGAARSPRQRISVKLSAIHPRYEFAQQGRVLRARADRPHAAAGACGGQEHGIGLTIDAEEADRLDLSLDIIEALARAPELKGWDGLGLAIQAYQKRAPPLIAWLTTWAARTGAAS